MSPSPRRLVRPAVMAAVGFAASLPCGAQTISGAVRSDGSGAVLPGATVRLLDGNDTELARVRADAEGRFLVRVDEPGRYFILVEAPGYAATLSDPIPVRGRGLVDLPVRMVRLGAPVEPVAVVEATDLARACGARPGRGEGGIVVGQVRDPAGGTLRGVWVSAEWRSGGLPVRREVRSGVDGLYFFCGLPTGAALTLRAAATDRVGPGSEVTLHADAVHRFDVALPERVSDRPGRVLGRIVDVGTGEGLASAELTIQGTSLRIWTDTHGHFAMDSVPPGLHTLRVDHFAYAARDVGIVVAPDGSHGLHVPMAHEAIELDPVVVTVRSTRWYGEMRAFQRRMLLSAGAFFTREDIRRYQPTRLVDLLREVPGVDVHDGPEGPPVVRMRGRTCDPDLVVDRVRRRDRAILTELRGEDMEAVEVYRSAAENPGEVVGSAACGAILVWTRRSVV